MFLQCSVFTFVKNFERRLLNHYLTWSIDGLVQDCTNSISHALELLQYCTEHRYVILLLIRAHWPVATAYPLHMPYLNVEIKLFTILVQCRHAQWWRHEMDTFSVLPAHCAVNSPVTFEFPWRRPVTRIFDVFFDLRLNNRLRKQSRRRWFESPRAHYDVTVMGKGLTVNIFAPGRYGSHLNQLFSY